MNSNSCASPTKTGTEDRKDGSRASSQQQRHIGQMLGYEVGLDSSIMLCSAYLAPDNH